MGLPRPRGSPIALPATDWSSSLSRGCGVLVGRERKNALLDPLRSRTTCENAGLHSGERVIADKDEVPGSSPGRPTTHRRRSERCRQRAGSARCRLGPRWGRTPIPAGTSSGPSGAAHPAVGLGDDHPPWSRPQPRTAARWRVQPPRAAACSRAHSAAARDGRSPRRPGLLGRSVVKRGRRGPHPTRGPGSATDLPLTNPTWAASPRPGLLDRRSSRRRLGSHRGLHPSCGQGRPATSTWVPNATA
jgi:hypothetical protein